MRFNMVNTLILGVRKMGVRNTDKWRTDLDPSYRQGGPPRGDKTGLTINLMQQLIQPLPRNISGTEDFDDTRNDKNR